MEEIEIEVLVAGPEHEVYVDTILETIAEAAKVRGTGIAKRTHEYLTKKMLEAKAVIALRKSKARFPACGGFLVWMGHDSFPCPLNTSIIDFDGALKPAAHALSAIWKTNPENL